ncbi:MAG: hypothetical protein IKB27_02195 [Clostridia bacterium]|nr:hypothetical protein [Clostridia bacterium]
MKKRILCIVLCLVMLAGMMTAFSGCGGSGGADAFVIQSEELDGLFNPFYATTGPDNTIVGMTQIGMLTSKIGSDGKVTYAYGDDQAVATKDFAFEANSAKTETTYTFVLKKNILFSDGHPLTIEDVLFNLYVYLDPVYTGSNTMYSTDIKGLSAYRTQTISSGTTNNDEQITSNAQRKAQLRINELLAVYIQNFRTNSGYNATDAQMREAIKNHILSDGYKGTIAVDKGQTVTNDKLLEDYELALKYFREELETDYTTAQSAYTEGAYKEREEFKNEIVCYMYHEGFVKLTYADKANADGTVEPQGDKSKIVKVELNYDTDTITNKEEAINFVYTVTTQSKFDQILQYWATAQKLHTEFTAEAKEVILHEGMKDDGSLKVPSIEGIKSLAHTSLAGTTITVNGNEYKIATADGRDANGVPTDGYDVLQITINGQDPKAHWNFSFTVAPQHYYGEGSSVGVDIKNNKFGVEFGTYSFMTGVIQSPRNIRVPMGAGAYQATDRSNGDPTSSTFFVDKVVYFKRNENFTTVDDNAASDPIKNAKIEKVRYQVIPATDAIGMLERGSVHYISPQLTDDNYAELDRLKATGSFDRIITNQLGYGYIGVNAKEVSNLNLRKAIMCAMNTALAVGYYRDGTAEQIYWPMSQVSWAHPVVGYDASGNPIYSKDNGHDYPQLNESWNEQTARDNISKYMRAAGVSAGDPSLKLTFTIAGSNLTDHPTYTVFRDAAALLNDMGWEITVVADTQALTKLATGSLAVWAAAWGSTIDPDLYQVYHKNSTATSTLAWGYPAIKNSGTKAEKDILDQLSKLIDQARETLDQDERTALYEQAMSKILDLAIELPVYQRSVVYAFNTNVIDASTLPAEVNPYSSPLDRIWEIDFAK